MIQIDTFNDLALLIQSDKLTNKQVFDVVQSTMGLLLSFDEEKLPRNELVKRLTEHHNKYLQDNTQLRPLFLNLKLSVI
jgi:allophanate hydrolase subunit 1